MAASISELVRQIVLQDYSKLKERSTYDEYSFSSIWIGQEGFF